MATVPTFGGWEKELGLARKDFYPTVSVEGNYFKRSTQWTLEAQEDILDPDGWSIIGVATWDFWQWGRSSFGEREKRSQLSQAKISREQALFQIRLEVERSFLKARESERNIVTIETAIEQAWPRVMVGTKASRAGVLQEKPLGPVGHPLLTSGKPAPR